MKYGTNFVTRLGDIYIIEEDGYITNVDFRAFDKNFYIEKITPLIESAIAQINEYLEGTRINFDIKIRPKGTDFQNKVWQELCKIEYGRAVSYQDMAAKIGNLSAVRAVGKAIGKNPILIVIPCHRVIGKDRSLVGFACGIDIKIELLNLEKIEYKKI